LSREKDILNNIELHTKENFVLISVNPKIYPLEVVYSAAYAMMEKSYVIIDGNPEEEIFVELTPKLKMNLLELGREFNNELLNYAVYMTQTARNQSIRDVLIQRAFLTATQDRSSETQTEEKKETEPNVGTGEESYLDDPLDIAKPWQPKSEKDESKN
jgi:His-Xaa-Ser system protein HxsD